LTFSIESLGSTWKKKCQYLQAKLQQALELQNNVLSPFYFLKAQQQQQQQQQQKQLSVGKLKICCQLSDIHKM